MKEKKKLLSIFAVLLLAVFAIVCVFGVACKGNKEEDGPEPSPEITVVHTHSYEVSWDWGTDYTTCDVTLTCTSTEGECDKPTVTDKATVTSVDTTVTTCVGEGVKTYTATYEYDGKTYTDTKTETLAALGHAWPANDDAENVDWQWESRTDEVVSLVVTCERCGVTLLDEEVEYETEETDGTTILSAEYEVDETLTYTSEYDTVNDPEEHAHHYEPTAWNWSEDYTTCTVTLTCESVVGECPEGEETITEYATITSEETTPATCEEEGEMTYTATLVYGGHTYTDTETEAIDALGHDYDATNATWEWAIDSEGKATATVTIACSRDSSHAAWTCTETGIEIDADGLYHASITGPDGVTPLTDGYELVEVQKEYHIDFSDPDTYSWMDTTFKTESSKGIISFPISDGTTIGQEMENSLNTGGAASDSKGRYFKLDLSEYVGDVVTITVTMCSNSSASRSLFISTTVTTSGALVTATSSAKDVDQLVTLYYSAEITEATKILYITCDASVNIFTIDVVIQDASEVVPEVQRVAVSPSTLTLAEGETGTLTATVTMNIGDYDGEYDWILSDGGIIGMTWDGSVATVTAIATGTVTVTVKADGKEAMCTVTVKEVSTASLEKSFIVPIAGDIDHVSKDEFAAGSDIEDNSLFTLTAVVAMKYSAGKTSSSSSLGSEVEYGAIQEGSNAASFVDMHGNTVNPDQGIKMSTAIPKSENSVVSESGTIITVTAKENITLYLYVQFTADGYSGNRAGKIMYSVGGSEKIVAVEGTSSSKVERKNVVTISIDLEKGQVLSVEAENIDSSSANFWLFGAEAKVSGGVTENDGETEYELAIVGSTGTSQGSDPVVVTGEIGTVTIKYVDDGTTKGPSYKSDNKVSIEGTEYNPVKYESKDEITITVTTACTVTIVCRGKYTSATAEGGGTEAVPESWAAPAFSVKDSGGSTVTITTTYDAENNLWYVSFGASENETYSLNRSAEDLIYAVAFTN